MLNKKIRLLLGLVYLSCFGFSQTKVSNQSGGWSNAAIWTPTGVPSSTDNVTIANGHTVSIGASGTCSNLNVGTGGVAAVLQFTGNTARTLTVGGNITINTSATFSTLTTSNVTHSILLSGNLVNNGVLNLRGDNNSLVNVTFNRNGNQTISGSGSQTQFNRMTLNMGSSAANVLEATSTTFSTGSNFLILTNGTFKLSSPATNTLVPFTAATTVAATAGLWLNTSASILSCSAGVSYSGQIQVSSGTLFIGNANNEDLTARGGTLSVSGGSVVIAGKFNASIAATTFSMSGGIIRISNNNSTNTSIAPFQISVSGSVFNMSGGTIVLRREGGNGAQDLGYVNTGATSGAVTGGTIQFGDNTSPASQNIRINSTYSVPTLVVNSASVNAILNTNSLVVTGDVSISTGTFSSNNLNISVGGNWSNSAGTFSPGTAAVIFNSSSAQNISKTGGETFNSILFSGSGTKTFSSAIAASGNFSISSGSTVDVSSSNYSLSVAGNFVNNGGFTQRNGTVLLNGTSSQSITGTSATTFYNLTLNNNSGATLGNAMSFEGTLQLNNGTLNVNSQSLTLVSNSAGTARVGSIAGTGNISGNMIVQRHVPGGTTGWAFWGTPMSSAHTMNDWDDDIAISCPTCPDGYVSGFTSIYRYDETVTGSYSSAASYVAMSTINDAITTGRGYWVYVGNGAVSTTDILIDITGTIQKFNYAIPLNFTNSGSSADDGWNLITNPYPSPISWTSLRGATANIDDAIYVYNADLNSGTGGYATYINGVSSPATSSGGIGDNIPMGQGFYVHSTGATSLQASESIKVSSTQALLKPSTAPTHTLLRLQLKSSGAYSDETVLYFEPNATINFEENFDAYKMSPLDPQSPVLALNQGTVDFQINGIAPVSGSFSIPVKALAGISGNFTISAQGLNDFPKGACITLYDKVTATTTDLRNSSSTFYLSDTTQAARFVLNITLNALNITTQVQQPNCANPSQGQIIANGLSQGSWNYYWTQNGNVVKTSLNKTGADTLSNISGGSYELEMNTIGQCDSHQSAYFMIAQIPVTASFAGPDTVLLSQANAVVFTNQSQNSVGQIWNSGNGQASSSANAIFNYTQPGNYRVSLVSTSGSGCVDSTHHNLYVKDDMTGISKQSITNHLLVKTLGGNSYAVSGEELAGNCELKLFDLTGREIESFENKESYTVEINLSNYPKGIYILTISGKNSQKHNLKLIAE